MPTSVSVIAQSVVRTRAPGAAGRAGRTGRRTGTPCAAGASRGRPGLRRSPGSAPTSSTGNGDAACCCATSAASVRPRSVSSRSPGARPKVITQVVAGTQGKIVHASSSRACESSAHRGSIGASCPCSGSSLRFAPQSAHRPAAVLPAQRLERQVQHHLVAEQRLEVDQVALQPAGLLLDRLALGMDVQLLDVDLQLVGDLGQAPYALPAQLCTSRCRSPARPRPLTRAAGRARSATPVAPRSPRYRDPLGAGDGTS